MWNEASTHFYQLLSMNFWGIIRNVVHTCIILYPGYWIIVKGKFTCKFMYIFHYKFLISAHLLCSPCKGSNSLVFKSLRHHSIFFNWPRIKHNDFAGISPWKSLISIKKNHFACHVLCCFVEDQNDPMIEHTYSQGACSLRAWTVLGRC